MHFNNFALLDIKGTKKVSKWMNFEYDAIDFSPKVHVLDRKTTYQTNISNWKATTCKMTLVFVNLEIANTSLVASFYW